MQSDISPLFNNLKSSVSQIDLTISQKEEFIKIVKQLDDLGHEIMYILIRMFEKDITGQMAELPFESKISTKELKLDIENLPIPLRWMLLKFSKLHLEKMEEETARKNISLKS